MPTNRVPTNRLPINWTNLSFLAGTHLVAICGTAYYLTQHGLSTAAVVLTAAWIGATGIAITAGYHRLFSHVSYESHWALKLFMLIFGAAAFQNSAFRWARDHRRHHMQVDTENDPYNIKLGFWNAHIGWVIRKEDPFVVQPSTPDLDADRLVQWQDRHYVKIAIVAGLIAPALAGWACGDWLGGLLVVGFARIVAIHHATFSINSFAHFFGSQPFSDKDSSRDSFFTAFISLGEGYHNFHHTFPGDFRNGVRWFHFDPTKWFLSALVPTGITSRLRRTPEPWILRARIQMQLRAAEKKLAASASEAQVLPALLRARASLDARLDHWRELAAEQRRWARGVEQMARDRLELVRGDVSKARADFHLAYARWKKVCSRPELALTVSITT